MSKIDALLERLDGIIATGPGRWSARCPAHPDRSPSLAVRVLEGDDKVLLHCFSGCSTEDILAALGVGWAAICPDRPYGQALAAGHRRRQKTLADSSQREYAQNVLRIAAADRRQGRLHTPEDQATIDMAVKIMLGGQSHG